MPTVLAQTIKIQSGLISNLTGQILQERYLVGKIVSTSGLNSYVFQVDDLKNKKTDLVVKVSSDAQAIANEVTTLLELRKI